jgi:hypothetical protein
MPSPRSSPKTTRSLRTCSALPCIHSISSAPSGSAGKGSGRQEIAAAFFVTPQVVKHRLKLAAVVPALLELYAEDEMTLEKLMAFTVNPDQERQL